MAIQVDTLSGSVTINNQAPATVSTQDLIDTPTIVSVNNILNIDNRILIINELTVENGATLICDDEEGTLSVVGVTQIDAGGTLDIGRFTADFENTGVAKQTDGLALKLGNTMTVGGTINWYSGMIWSGTDAHQFNNGSTVNFFGGSWLNGDPGLTSGTSRFRINNGSTQNFNGNIAGTDEQGIFTIRGRSRFDIFAGSTQNFTNNGGFTADYTPAAAFQVVQGGDLFEFFGVGSRGLPNNFVCDAFGDAQLKIRNPGTAGARYNITHQLSSLNNSWSFLTQDYDPIVLNTDRSLLENAFMYMIDEVGTAGGTDQADRRVAGPATMAWNSNNTTDPVFGGSPDGRYNAQIIYQGLTGADGRVINEGANPVTGTGATGRGNEVVTRLLIGGASPGGVFTDNGNQGLVSTNYRWSIDNNDTAQVRWAAYGRLRTNINVNLIGTGAPIDDTPVLALDPVVEAANRTAAQAATAFAGTITSSNDIIAAIEHFQTPQTGTDNASLFRFSATTAEKAWTGITGGSVDFPNRDMSFVQTGTGIAFDTANDVITVNGMNTFTQSDVNINLGTGDFLITNPVSSYAGMSITCDDAVVTGANDTSNITINGTSVSLLSYTGNFTSGVTLGGAVTGLPLTPNVGLLNGATVSYTAGSTVDWRNVTLPDTGSVTILGNNLQIFGVPQADRNTRVLINQAPSTGSTFQDDAIINTVNIPTTIAGYYAITQTINGTETQVVAPTRFTAGSTITSPNFDDNTFTAGRDTINVYVKYDSDVTNNIYYVEQLLNFTFSSTQGTVHQVNIPVSVSGALVGTATPLPANVGVATVFNDALSANNVLVTVTNTSAQSALSLGQNQGLTLAATIGNTEAYFDSWYGNRATTVNPMLEFRQNETVNWDNTRVTFASGNLSDGFRIQHVVQNWESTGAGTFALARTGAGEISPQISGAAAISTVIAAVDSSSSIQQIRRGVGYTIDSPLISAPNTNGPYSNTGDYGDDL